MANAKATVLVDAKHVIAHNKVIIVDGAIVLTGSFNFTLQAEQGNAENMVALHDPGLTVAYVNNWKLHASHSTPFHGCTP